MINVVRSEVKIKLFIIFKNVADDGAIFLAPVYDGCIFENVSSKWKSLKDIPNIAAIITHNENVRQYMAQKFKVDYFLSYPSTSVTTGGTFIVAMVGSGQQFLRGSPTETAEWRLASRP